MRAVVLLAILLAAAPAAAQPKTIVVAPLSIIEPANSEGTSVAETAPTGGETLSPSTLPVAVNVRREGGPPRSQRCRFTSCAWSVNFRAP